MESSEGGSERKNHFKNNQLLLIAPTKTAPATESKTGSKPAKRKSDQVVVHQKKEKKIKLATIPADKKAGKKLTVKNVTKPKTLKNKNTSSRSSPDIVNIGSHIIGSDDARSCGPRAKHGDGNGHSVVDVDDDDDDDSFNNNGDGASENSRLLVAKPQPLPPLPIKKARKLRKPVAEEDVVEGFAFIAFKNYEELNRAIKLGEENSADTNSLFVQVLKGSRIATNGSSTDKTPTTNTKLLNQLKFVNKSSPAEKKTGAKLPKATTTKYYKKKEKVKENCCTGMVSKMPNNENSFGLSRSIESESPVSKPKKARNSNGAGNKDGKQKLKCGPRKDKKVKISDGCTDLFAPPRKDSSPNQLDNLHSPLEKKDNNDSPQNLINHEIYSTCTASAESSTTNSTVNPPESKSVIETSDSSSPPCTPRLHSNGSVTNTNEDQNGYSEETDVAAKVEPSVKEKPIVQKQTVHRHTLFTPYATTSITRVTTPTESSGGQSSSSHSISDKLTNDTTEPSSVVTRSNHSNSSSNSSSSSFNYSGKEFNSNDTSYNNNHQPSSASIIIFDKAGIGASSSALGTSHNIKSSQVTPTVNSKSTGFESIARLLDSSSTRTNRNSSPSSKSSRNRRNSNSPNHSQPVGNHSIGTSTFGCSSRSLSPTGHSPNRERDSYSSNVSSLSRTSGTPVNGSSQQLPSNLSPLQNLSHSKATSWLSGASGLSPVPRPTPPPIPCSSSASAAYSHCGTSLSSVTTQSPHSIYSGLIPPSTHHSAMFAPPMLPLSSMMQPSPYGPSQDNIFQASPSELVRRDLESRFLAERNASGSGPNSFMPRPGDMHTHHLLQHLPGVNHLPNPGGPNSMPPHSPLFTPPFFKDLPKLGLDSPFYRTALGMSYPGFNGMLPPSNITTPFTPPSQLPTFTPKKSGRWNAMHVRIAWEIYQHQQKNSGETKTTSIPSSSTKNSVTKSSNSTNTSNTLSMSLTPSDLLRSNHSFSDMNRPPDIGPPHFSPLLSSHPSTPRPPFDPNQPLFLQSPPHLGPPISRSYPAFGPLGPSFGGLTLGSSLLGRDISSLGPLPSHDQWLRMQRAAQFPVWPPHLRDLKSESHGHKDERSDKRNDSSNSESKGGTRDPSPRDRSRSPVRSSRTSVENGDTDSRSSSSNSTTTKSSGHRVREESNGDREKIAMPLTLADRDKFSHHNLINDKALSFIPSTYSSRMFNPPSPLTTGWDSFPGMPGGPRISSAESFRLSLLQLSERERELSRAPPQSQLRPQLPSNGPFMNLPLGITGAPPPRSNSSGSTKSSPSSGSIPLLNPSMSVSALGVLPSFHGQHHHSSQNGPNSPTKSDEPANSRKSKEESR